MRLIPFLSFVIFLASCQSKKSFEVDREVEKIVIDDPDSYDSLISTRDLLTDVSYIKLQTDSFTISKSGKILEFNNRIFVHDRMKNVLAVYGPNGSYKGLVGEKGYGPQEHRTVSDFDVDLVNQVIIIFSRDDLSFIVYDKDLAFKKKVKIDIWAFKMSILDNGLLAFYSSFDENIENNNITIYNIDGQKISELMPFPSNGSYMPIDYSGFLKGNFYTYPLSTIIYKIQTETDTSYEFMNIDIPGERDEKKRYNQSAWLGDEWMQTQILSDFTVGPDEKELLFYYSIHHSGTHSYSLGLKLRSGEIFSHANMRHSSKKHSDVFNILFFHGPYGLPNYSKNTGYYYGSTSGDTMFWYLSKNTNNKLLNEAQSIDPNLSGILRGLENDQEHTILMKFKLKSSYE